VGGKGDGRRKREGRELVPPQLQGAAAMRTAATWAGSLEEMESHQR
jgi:hypothetical protein